MSPTRTLPPLNPDAVSVAAARVLSSAGASAGGSPGGRRSPGSTAGDWSTGGGLRLPAASEEAGEEVDGTTLGLMEGAVGAAGEAGVAGAAGVEEEEGAAGEAGAAEQEGAVEAGLAAAVEAEAEPEPEPGAASAVEGEPHEDPALQTPQALDETGGGSGGGGGTGTGGGVRVELSVTLPSISSRSGARSPRRISRALALASLRFPAVIGEFHGVSGAVCEAGAYTRSWVKLGYTVDRRAQVELKSKRV